MKFIKLLLAWIIRLFKGNKPTYIEYKTKDVIKPLKRDKTHEEHLKIFKSKRKAKQYPLISDKLYNRLYSRHIELKEKKEYQHELVLKGKRLDEKGNIITVQQPYIKSNYKSLEDYNKYVRLLNYTGK